jgi:hypothetical protein
MFEAKNHVERDEKPRKAENHVERDECWYRGDEGFLPSDCLDLKHFGEHTPGEYINILANRDAANPAQNPYQIVPGVGQTPSF